MLNKTNQKLYELNRKITDLAKKRRMSRNDFLRAIIEFFILNEDKISIIDGKIFYKENNDILKKRNHADVII